MFENIGKKIKGLAKLVTAVGFIGSVIAFFILLNYDMTGLAFVVLIVGVLVSWIGSFSLYAYGEIADNTKGILEYMKINKISASQLSEENSIPAEPVDFNTQATSDTSVLENEPVSLKNVDTVIEDVKTKKVGVQ